MKKYEAIVVVEAANWAEANEWLTERLADGPKVVPFDKYSAARVLDHGYRAENTELRAQLDYANTAYGGARAALDERES